jgi:hypothetical protein
MDFNSLSFLWLICALWHGWIIAWRKPIMKDDNTFKTPKSQNSKTPSKLKDKS